MSTQSGINLQITPNADGYSIAGGITPRAITITGADITLTGSGSAVITFPTTSATLARTDAGQTFTGTQVFSSTISGSISGTATNLSGTPAVPNGTTATTQSAKDNSTKLATTAYVDKADLKSIGIMIALSNAIYFN